MKIDKIYWLKLIIILILFSHHIFAQEITDVSFEVVDEKILIYYTLTPINSDEFEITTLLKRTTNPSFSYLPAKLSGDIGEGKYSGTQKRIIWDVSEREMNMFDGEDFYFEVYAKKIEPSGGIPWYYYAGTAAVGGAAVLLLGGGDDNKTTSPATSNFAPPPGRP